MANPEPQREVAARQLEACLQAQDMVELERRLLAIGLQEACGPSFLDFCRSHGLDKLVLMLATLAVDNGIEVEPAQQILDVYQSAHQRQFQGSLATLPATHVLRQAVAAWWGGKNLPLPACGTRRTERRQGSRSEFELALEFLLDHSCTAAARSLVIERCRSGPIDDHQLRLVRTLLRRHGLRTLPLAAQSDLSDTYVAVHDALKGRAEFAGLQESLAMLVAEGYMRGRDPLQALPWCARARTLAARLKAAYMETAVHCRTGSIESANHSMDRLLDLLLQQPAAQAQKIFVAPGGNAREPGGFDLAAARSALTDLNHVMDPIGHRPFLVSGTLLGYERVRDFLSHDKDIDVGLFGHEDCFEVLQHLHQSGLFTIKTKGVQLGRTYNVCVWHRPTGMAIDIFFYHPQDGRLVTGVLNDIGYLQNFSFTPFDVQPIEFVGVKSWAPTNIDLNLRENFGDWRVPDAGYISHLESPATVDPGGPVHLLVARLKFFEAYLKNSAKMGLRVCRQLDGPLAGSPSRVQPALLERLRSHFQARATQVADPLTNTDRQPA